MRKFWVLLRKEVAELITPQSLLPFVLIVILFAGIGNVVESEGAEERASARVMVLDEDGSDASRAVVAALEEAGFKVTSPAEGLGADALPSVMREDGEALGIAIPAGFGDGLSAGAPQTIRTFTTVTTVAYTGTQDAGKLGGVLAAVNDTLSAQLIASGMPTADPATVKAPMRIEETVIVGDEAAVTSSAEVLSFVGQQMTFIPIVLFIVIIFASQMIATTIASEKENKTLETLLASPVSRSSLITAKMSAAGLIALLSAAAYMVGLTRYMNGLMSGMGETGRMGGATDAVRQLGLTMQTGEWVLLGASMFLSILVALAIAMILGAFAENVKAVQSLLAPLTVIIMVPYFLSIFIDLGSAAAPLKWGVLAIPFTHSFMAAPNLMFGDVTSVLLGIAYQSAWVIALTSAAARLFSSDRLLTMKLDLRRKGRKRA